MQTKLTNSCNAYVSEKLSQYPVNRKISVSSNLLLLRYVKHCYRNQTSASTDLKYAKLCLDTFHICSMIYGFLEGMGIRYNSNLHEKRIRLKEKLKLSLLIDTFNNFKGT